MEATVMWLTPWSTARTRSVDPPQGCDADGVLLFGVELPLTRRGIPPFLPIQVSNEESACRQEKVPYGTHATDPCPADAELDVAVMGGTGDASAAPKVRADLGKDALGELRNPGPGTLEAVGIRSESSHRRWRRPVVEEASGARKGTGMNDATVRNGGEEPTMLLILTLEAA